MRKYLAMMLALSMLLTVGSPGFAIDNEQIDQDFSQISRIGLNLLQDIRFEQDKYGLEDIDFDRLYFAEYIPAYFTSKNVLIASEMRYYPILEDDIWVATLVAVQDMDGEWNAQISNDFVSNLSTISTDGELVLIFDNKKGYLLNPEGINEISRYELIADRTPIEQTPMMLSKLETGALVAKSAIHLSGVATYASGDIITDTQAFLSVPLVTKFAGNEQSNPDNGACWAASCVSIGKYCGIAKTMQQVYTYSGYTYPEYTYRSNSLAIGALSNYFGLNVESGLNVNFASIKFSLQNSRPLYASATIASGGSGNGHAIVIRGYVEYAQADAIGSFSYMDSDKNPAVYKAASITGHNGLTYISPINGLSYPVTNITSVW